jgi:carboxylate-amine ligase
MAARFDSSPEDANGSAESGARIAPTGGSVAFAPSAGRTVGVEWEVGLVDPASLDLASAADQLLARLGLPALPAHTPAVGSTGPRVTTELLRNTVELVTGVCANAGEAAEDLGSMLARVSEAAGDLGLELFGAGSHPFARWESQQISPGERYATLIDRTQWWGRQMLIFGVHVHVGVRSAAKVWPLINGLLTYYPHLTALSASSPFWAGVDTGYASNRAMMFQQLPTAGLPFQFQNWAAYQRYLEDVFVTGVVDDVSELRWDIRPSPRLGTIEVRICDSMSSIDQVAALTALTHCLVVHLENRLDAGTLPPMLPPWHVQENKWRAARYGLDAIVVLDADNREGLVTDDIRELLGVLDPVARRLGCRHELELVEHILEGGAGYQRQRAAVEAADGDLAAAVRVTSGELRGSLAGSPR